MEEEEEEENMEEDLSGIGSEEVKFFFFLQL